MRVSYKVPKELFAEQDVFEGQIRQFVSGEIDPIAFKAMRVAHGVYEQRQNDTYMIRIRCAAGAVTPLQLQKVAKLAGLYGSDEVHFTTRQELQIHNVIISDVMKVIRELNEVGLSSRGGGGNTVRNILTPPDSGINNEEVFDVDPYAMALTTRMISEADSWNLPRKFKIAFSYNDQDIAITQSTCLGFVARMKDGQKGFRVFCAGGMGAKPLLGHCLIDFIPDTRVYHVARAMKTMFDKHGNRKSKTTSRIKFLWLQQGREGFEKLFSEYYDKIKNDDSLALDIAPFCYENSALETSLTVQQPEKEFSNYYETFKERFVFQQKQQGLVSIKIPLRLGDLEREDADKLCNFLKYFGDNTIRCDRAQNMRIRNVPEIYLANAFNIIMSMKRTLVRLPAFLSNMVNCTGASTCKLGICLPRGLSDALRDRLSKSDLDLDRLKDFRLNMSGCPNTCGMHHVAHLGFFGKVMRKSGNMYPAYNVLAGARIFSGKTQYATKYGEIAAHHIPDFVHDFLQDYLKHMDSYADYYAYLEQRGVQTIEALCAKYAEVPEYDDDPKYYKDFGAKKRLTLDELGTAECSASMFDIIGVDRRIVRNAKKLLEKKQAMNDQEAVELFWNVLFAAARMLLVTRGLDGKNELKAFELFKKHFIIAGLVPEKYIPLLDQAIEVARTDDEKAKNFVLSRREEIMELSDYMMELYDSMDNSLRFNLPKLEQPTS